MEDGRDFLSAVGVLLLPLLLLLLFLTRWILLLQTTQHSGSCRLPTAYENISDIKLLFSSINYLSQQL